MTDAAYSYFVMFKKEPK